LIVSIGGRIVVVRNFSYRCRGFLGSRWHLEVCSGSESHNGRKRRGRKRTRLSSRKENVCAAEENFGIA
jgi:hypothetical protein